MTESIFPSSGLLRRTSRRLAALVLSAAIVTAGIFATTAPARAQSGDDLVRFLLGAAAVAVIIRSFDAQANVRYIDRRTLPQECLETVRMRGRHVDVYHRGCLSRAGYRRLPQQCEVSFRTNRGHRTGYEARCMHRLGYRAGRGHHGHGTPQRPRPERLGILPAHCTMTYRQGSHRHDGYWGSCLHGVGLRRLPERCQVARHGRDTIYNAQCLRSAGYQTGRR